MTSTSIIAVFGATGAQGGGLIRAILNDAESPFTIRAITRNPQSEKAQALAAQGIEVVQADLNDLESLVTALRGCTAAFCVTNFWDTFSAEIEKQQAKNLAQACKQANIQHAIWSTLEDTRRFFPITDQRMPVLQEHYNVPHFDAKGEADAFFQEAGVSTTFLATSYYWENLIYFGTGPQRGQDGKLYFTMPMADAKLPGIAAEDIGRIAYGVFKRGKEFVGTYVYAAGECVSGADMARGMSSVIGEEVIYNDADPDVYRQFGFPGADEMGNMFQFKRDFTAEYVGVREANRDLISQLNPKTMSFSEWLAVYGKHIPVPTAEN